MQNDLNDATGGTPSPEQNTQSVPETLSPEPMYQEFAYSSASESSAKPVATFDAHLANSPKNVAPVPTPQPSAVPSAPYEGIGGWPTPPVTPPVMPGYYPNTAQPVYQPGTFPPMASAPPAQPGYLPPTSQPGYMPPPQPGFVPITAQPGYLPPNYVTGPLPPGYPPPMPPQPPKKRGMWAIMSMILAGVLLLAVILTGVLYNGNVIGPSRTATSGTQSAQSTTAPTTTIGQPTSAFQAASCPFPVGAGLTEGQQVSCGYVTVPENRAVNNSGKVKLAVAIFRAPQYMTTPDPAPVLRLDGGPGGPSLATFAQFVNAADYSSLVFDHDQIMFDQRGTGFSTPSLQCKELIQLQYSTSDVSAQNYEQQAQACHDRLVQQGIDLNGFNSLQDAADVRDLIHALGYQKMTVYGVSYGTRLALTVMRLYPDVVRDAVLDSVYPPNHNRTDLPSDAQRVFNVFFQGCAKDPSCNSKYPDLQNVFYNLVGTLNAKPVSFQATDSTTGQTYTVPLSGNDLVSWLFSSFYVTSFIPLLPQTIFQVRDHNYTQISQIEGAIGFDSTFSDGMFYSVECSEDWPFLTQQDITTSLQGITPQIATVFSQDEQQEYSVCQFWNVQKVPAVQKQPVVSSLPTLVLSGEYDPITPPSNGQETASHLSNSYFFIFPGQGHGQEYSSACSDTVINAFEDTPTQKPDASCIAQMTEPAFQ